MADGLLFEKRPSSGNAVGSYLFLLIIGIQGFHVVEHIVLVIQVQALHMGLAEAHGLLGARVDFEWLHFSYNSAFLGALILILAYGLRHRQELPAATGIPGMALAGAVGLQTYHVAEHVIRIVQYYQTGCTPCVGLIGRVVPFIWPHLFFGLIAYIPMVVCYFAYGLHQRLPLPFLRRSAAPAVVVSLQSTLTLRVPSLPPFSAPGLDPQAIPRFTILERQDSDG